MIFKTQFPNLITLVNLFFGFLSILNSYIANYSLACYFILLAAVLDSLDGKIARLFGVSTEFGKELDSLADLVSFCLAPSVLVYILYSQNMPGISGELIAAAPLLLGVIRLAHYNISENENTSYFKGLPTTFNAIFICSLILYIENIKTIAPEYSQPRFLLPIIVSSSFLMISRIKYPKFPLINFHSGKSNSIGLVIIISILFLFLFSILFNQEETIFILFSSGLIILGLFNHLFINEKIHLNFVKKFIKRN
jgi:CDP-diacylglycerol--serine O-phosphatidyltransferase